MVEVRCDVLYVNGEPTPHRALEQECTYSGFGHAGGWREYECALFEESLGGYDYQAIQNPTFERSAGEPGDMDFPGMGLPGCENSADGLQYEPVQVPGVFVESANSSEDACAPSRGYKVPKGHFFVMGDNRGNSSDSRIWGPVPNSSLRGIASYVWWAKQGESVNWGRIGFDLE